MDSVLHENELTTLNRAASVNSCFKPATHAPDPASVIYSTKSFRYNEEYLEQVIGAISDLGNNAMGSVYSEFRRGSCHA